MGPPVGADPALAGGFINKNGAAQEAIAVLRSYQMPYGNSSF